MTIDFPACVFCFIVFCGSVEAELKHGDDLLTPKHICGPEALSITQDKKRQKKREKVSNTEWSGLLKKTTKKNFPVIVNESIMSRCLRCNHNQGGRNCEPAPESVVSVPKPLRRSDQ